MEGRGGGEAAEDMAKEWTAEFKRPTWGRRRHRPSWLSDFTERMRGQKVGAHIKGDSGK